MSATRTFRELVTGRGSFNGMCRACKNIRPVWKYGLRQYICEPCAMKRADEVMPSVVKYEAFQRRLAAIQAATAAREAP